MFEGANDIRAAAEALATRDEKLKSRLEEAGKEFWSALYHVDDWPDDLERQAKELQAALLNEGTIADTVARMSRKEAEDTARKRLHFMVEFELGSTRQGRDGSDPQDA